VNSEFDTSQPIYLQLQQRICRQIVRGELKPGDKLPAVRQMAAQVGVNPNTMQRVYAGLEQEGIVSVRRGEGSFVTEDAGRVAQLHEQLKDEHIAGFVADMGEMGFTADEIIAGVQTYIKTLNKGSGR